LFSPSQAKLFQHPGTIPDLKPNQQPISQSAIQSPESFRDALKQSLHQVGKWFKEPAQIGRGFRQLLFGKQFSIGINGNKNHSTAMQIDSYVNHDVLLSLCNWGIANLGGDVYFVKIKRVNGGQASQFLAHLMFYS
jgi:hypothetical protein